MFILTMGFQKETFIFTVEESVALEALGPLFMYVNVNCIYKGNLNED